MGLKIEVIAKVGDPEIIEMMRRKPAYFSLREAKTGVVVYFPSKDGIKYDVSPVLCNEEFWMNVNEGKDDDGLVTVVCSLDGRLMKPFWVKGKKNQREVDRTIDVRFSLLGSICVVSINKLGLLLIQKIWIEDRYEYAEVKTQELFSIVLKRNGGKFIFSEKMFGTRHHFECFLEAVKAATKKANAPDGAGPTFFVEKEPDIQVIYREEIPQMTITQKAGITVLSAGMTMRANPTKV